MVVAEILTGIALVKKSVDFIKENISTVQDIQGIAKQIDGFFLGEEQMNKGQGKGLGIKEQFGIESTANDFIDRKLLEEKRQELKKIINLKENDKVMIDGNEYEFQKFTVSRESKKFLPETGEIIQRPQAKGQLLRDVIVPRLSLIATDSSLPPEVRFLIPSLAEFLQKTD